MASALQPLLTPIERELVLQYLKDANVPVTITDISPACRNARDVQEEQGSREEGAQRLPYTAVFPVLARGAAEAQAEGKADMIELQNPPQQVKDFAGRKARVEFYFNKMGLTFTSSVSADAKDGTLRLTLPSDIYRIQDDEDALRGEFDCSIYYSCSNNSKVDFRCISKEGYLLFCKPVWKDIALERQRLAKTYLESFVALARANSAYDNGLFLIPICRYLTDTPRHLSPIEGRIEPFTALYLDEKRLVFGYHPCLLPPPPAASSSASSGTLSNAGAASEFPLTAGAEYAVKLSIALYGALRREIYATIRLIMLYRGDIQNGGGRVCADCLFTSLKEEDKRYLSEKRRDARL